MATDPFEHFKMPSEMRAFAEQSVEQARKAFGGFIDAAANAAQNMQGQTAAAQEVAKKAIGFAQLNVAASFDFAQSLLRAKDAEEAMKLQREYVERQAKTLSEQARELGESAAAVAKRSFKPGS